MRARWDLALPSEEGDECVRILTALFAFGSGTVDVKLRWGKIDEAVRATTQVSLPLIAVTDSKAASLEEAILIAARDREAIPAGSIKQEEPQR